ncbi:MAG: DUF2505 domain-containing protein [Nocardioidaceae bacterium]
MMWAMDLHAEISYPHTSIDKVFALITDRGFRGEVCEATHALDHEVRVHQLDDAVTMVTVNRTMAAEVPAIARKFVGETIDVTQTEEWQPATDPGRRTANLNVSIKGQPAKVTGTITLDAIDGGVREVIDGEVKVSIPFIGKAIEPEVAKGITAALNTEQQLGQARLSRGA